MSRARSLRACFLPLVVLVAACRRGPEPTVPQTSTALDCPMISHPPLYYPFTRRLPAPSLPYDWLEYVGTPDVDAWTDAQNAFFRRQIPNTRSHEIAEELGKALGQIWETPFVRVHADKDGERHDRYFHGHHAVDEFSIAWQEGADGAPRVFATDDDIQVWSPSPDGTKLALVVRSPGSGELALVIRDVESGQQLAYLGKVVSTPPAWVDEDQVIAVVAERADKGNVASLVRFGFADGKLRARDTLFSTEASAKIRLFLENGVLVAFLEHAGLEDGRSSTEVLVQRTADPNTLFRVQPSAPTGGLDAKDSYVSAVAEKDVVFLLRSSKTSPGTIEVADLTPLKPPEKRDEAPRQGSSRSPNEPKPESPPTKAVVWLQAHTFSLDAQQTDDVMTDIAPTSSGLAVAYSRRMHARVEVRAYMSKTWLPLLRSVQFRDPVGAAILVRGGDAPSPAKARVLAFGVGDGADGERADVLLQSGELVPASAFTAGRAPAGRRPQIVFEYGLHDVPTPEFLAGMQVWLAEGGSYVFRPAGSGGNGSLSVGPIGDLNNMKEPRPIYGGHLFASYARGLPAPTSSANQLYIAGLCDSGLFAFRSDGDDCIAAIAGRETGKPPGGVILLEAGLDTDGARQLAAKWQAGGYDKSRVLARFDADPIAARADVFAYLLGPPEATADAGPRVPCPEK